ncbi:hypothetical protein B0T16DRAFT_454751 [Cercophora newfieldiana]|uniref:Uncharacterized protein n=1 Tax=Cercophora newfieldiana TaxID=92897 RepID=A0AA39YJZ2_9PEZI|nr:hypothetical protein B0T16DRAFT_454751 [Cercophora newfieldiana]
MQFKMEIDNPRKRCRALDDEYEEVHAAKKTRQSDTYAPCDSAVSSAVSTPASIDHDPFFSGPSKPQSSGSTIISGWNQARRDEDELRRNFPWLFRQVSN